MRLEELIFQNLRLFGGAEQTIQFCQDKKITILLGNNGTGKTSLLYGTTILLSQFFEPFPNISSRQFNDNDVHTVSNTAKAEYLHIKATLNVAGVAEAEDKHIEIEQYKKGNASKVPLSNLQEIKEYAAHVKSSIDNNQQIALPILAYYGTERGQIKAPERRRDFNSVFPRWDAYKDALEPVTNFKRFFTWFERNEDLERREQLKQYRDGQNGKQPIYTSPVLNAVREALSRMELHMTNPRVEESPLRFVMDDISTPNSPKEVRIEMMSDGYRIMIALIADIAARMAEANPDKPSSGLENPLDTSGIVFIDEIDLHLHPKWQRTVLRQLTSIFPNIQFIVSTHSPSVVLGAFDLAQVVKLDDGRVINNIDLTQYEAYDVSLLLLSDLFELTNVRTDLFAHLEQRLKELFARRDKLSDDERGEIQDLIQKIGHYRFVE